MRKWRAFFKTRLKRQVSAWWKYLSILLLIVGMLSAYILFTQPQGLADKILQLRYQYVYRYVVQEAETQNTLLRNLVLADYPQIEDDEMSDFERVSLLRQWAAGATDWSNREGLLDRPSTTNPYAGSFHFYSQDAATIYAAFMEDKGGVWCDGTAYALAKLYELFGYRAFRIGFGVPSSDATHVVTLVEIEHRTGGRKILSVQDAYFDFTYVHADGEPMDYFELLDLLQSHRDGDVTIVGSSIPIPHDFLYFENGYVRKTESVYFLENFEEQCRTELNSFYEERGFPQNILYLHLSVLWVSGLHEPERSEFTSKLSARGVWKG